MIEHNTQQVLPKAALARKLGIKRSTVSGYVDRGMPVRPDSKINLDEALAWIAAHVRPQAGRRGTGVRGAARLSPAAARGNGQGNPSMESLRETVRLTRARADLLELELERLRGGGSAGERARLANAIALHAWWCFQRDSPSGLAGIVAALADRGTDVRLMHEPTDRIRQRDEAILAEVRSVIADGLAGRLRTSEEE